MNDHDLIHLATKYGSWFGTTLEIRMPGLQSLARDLMKIAYQSGYNDAASDYVSRDAIKDSAELVEKGRVEVDKSGQ